MFIPVQANFKTQNKSNHLKKCLIFYGVSRIQNEGINGWVRSGVECRDTELLITGIYVEIKNVIAVEPATDF